MELQMMRALLDPIKGDAQGDGTLGMMGGQLRGVNRVKSAQQIQLAVVLRSRVAQNCHLDGHRLGGECSPGPELFSNNFGSQSFYFLKQFALKNITLKKQ